MASSSSTSAHFPLPTDLPKPEDDGACSHLIPGHPIPPTLTLPSTSGDPVTLATLPGLTILFLYPRTAAPNEVVPDSWNAIPGARGCTPQACAFRDAHAELLAKAVQRVFGVSTQSTEYQREVKGRVELGFELLSDEGLGMVEGLGVPTFEWEGGKVMRRVTLAIKGGEVVRCWYPVFPPDESAREVLEWLDGR